VYGSNKNPMFIALDIAILYECAGFEVHHSFYAEIVELVLIFKIF
jgi:hypothetical protein